MLLMAETGTRDRIGEAIERQAKANNKYMKNYDKNTTSSYLMYLYANNLYEWEMSQKLPVNGFEWVEKLSKFDERFIKKIKKKKMMKIVLKDIFLKQMLSIKKNYLIFIAIYYFHLKERKLENVISLFVTFMTRKTTLFT